MKTKRKEKFTIRWVARLVLVVFAVAIALCVFNGRKTYLVCHVNWEPDGTVHWEGTYEKPHMEPPYIQFVYDPETGESKAESITADEKKANLVTVQPTTIHINAFEACTFYYTYPEDLEYFGNFLEKIYGDMATTIAVRKVLGMIDPSTTPEEMNSMATELENMPLSERIEITGETVKALLRKLDGGRIEKQN